MIPFLDLKQINGRFKEVFQEEFVRFLDSGSYILGNSLENFEKEYATYCGVRYCLGVANGLEAIELIFRAYIERESLRKGDEVLVPANTYIASILAIINSGLKPVFVEPSEDYNINVKELEKKITNKTKAILVVHLYGKLVNMVEVNKLSKKHNLLCVEDAAQAHGAVDLKGRKSGALADAAAFSFYPSKNLGALGDGGAITTNDEGLYEVLLKIRNYGSSIKYNHELKGMNSRLDEIQAAFLSIKLKKLDADNNARREIAKYYNSHINNKKIFLPKEPFLKDHVWYAYVVRCSSRNELQNFLKENGVQTNIHYPLALHKQVALSEYSHLNFPVTEQVCDEILSLPISPVQTIADTQRIVELLNQF